MRDVLRLSAISWVVFGPKNCAQQDQYICYHQFTLFLTCFSDHFFFYLVAMPKVDLIKYNTKGSTAAYPFILSIANKNTIASNISIFENFNIIPYDLKKNTFVLMTFLPFGRVISKLRYKYLVYKLLE